MSAPTRERPPTELREAAGTRTGHRLGWRRRAPGPATTSARWWWLAAATLAVAISAIAALAPAGPVLRPQGAPLVLRFFGAALHPRVDPAFLGVVVHAAATTVGYAVLGAGASLVIGLVGGIGSSQTWWRTGRRGRGGLAGWTVVRAVLAVPRGVHEVVWGLFFLSVLGLDPVVAVLAIALPFGAVTAKVYSEILDETGAQPYRALLASGASRPVGVLYGLLPPALPELISYGFYRFECAIRSAAVLGLVGAGGLGFELAQSFSALRYDEIWTLLLALVVLCAVTDVWSSAVRRRQARGRRRDPALVLSVLVVAALVPASAWALRPDVGLLWAPRTWQLGQELAGQAWPPELGVPPAEFLGLVGVTVAMSVLAVAAAAGAGALLAFPAADLRPLLGGGGWSRWVVIAGVRAVLVLLRAVPPPVWALLCLFVLAPGVAAGAAALAVYTLGVLGRLMAESLENLEPRAARALRAAGAAPSAVLGYGVVPNAAPRFLAYSLYRWEVTVRETVVVGVVGAGGLGLALNTQLATFDYPGAVTTLAALVALTLGVDLVSAAARRSLR